MYIPAKFSLILVYFESIFEQIFVCFSKNKILFPLKPNSKTSDLILQALRGENFQIDKVTVGEKKIVHTSWI